MKDRIENLGHREKLGRHRNLLIEPETLVVEAIQSWHDQSQSSSLGERKDYPGITEAIKVGWAVVSLVGESNNLTRWVNRNGRLPRLNRHRWPKGEQL